jgi:hypothetical protein
LDPKHGLLIRTGLFAAHQVLLLFLNVSELNMEVLAGWGDIVVHRVISAEC